MTVTVTAKVQSVGKDSAYQEASGVGDARFREVTGTRTPGGIAEKSPSAVTWDKQRAGITGFNTPSYRYVSSDGRFEITKTSEMPGVLKFAHNSKATFWKIFDKDGKFRPSRTSLTIADAQERVASYLKTEGASSESEAPITGGSVTGRGLAPTAADIPSRGRGNWGHAGRPGQQGGSA